MDDKAFRSHTREWIDDPTLPLEDVRATLADQGAINRRLGGRAAVMHHLRRYLDRRSPGGVLRILELACGGGDVLRAAVREARGRGMRAEGVGLDRVPNVIAAAERWTPGAMPVRYLLGDVRRPPFDAKSFDLVLLPGVLHHLDGEGAVAALRAAAKLSRGCLIATDLRPSPLAHALFALLARAARMHPASRHDGAESLRRAREPRRMLEIAHRAGLRGATLWRHPFWRLALVDDARRNEDERP